VSRLKQTSNALERSLCHMGSHGVTCHRTEVNLPTLLPGIHQYSFYHPKEAGRLSRPRHCRKGAAARAQDCVSQ